MIQTFKPIIIRIQSGEYCKLIPVDERFNIGAGIKATEEELDGWLKLFPNKARPAIFRLRK